MTFPEKTRGRLAALLGAAGAFTLALPGAFAVASTVTVPDATEPADGTKLISIEQVPYRTIVVEDDSLPADVEVEEQAGIVGTKHVFATAAYQEAELLKMRENIVEAPQDRIILRGTNLALPKAEPAPEPEPEPEPEPVAEQPAADRGSQSFATQSTAPAAPAPAPAPPAVSSGQYSVNDLMFMGVVNWNGYKFTYYSQSVLPGGGLAIPGRHVSAAGFVSDGSGHIVLAAAPGIPHGTVFATPFGAPGKVYDTCASCTPNWLDVYTR